MSKNGADQENLLRTIQGIISNRQSWRIGFWDGLRLGIIIAAIITILIVIVFTIMSNV